MTAALALARAGAARCCGRGQLPRAAQPVRRASAASVRRSSRAAQVTLDRVVAIVNGDLILESDVDAERALRGVSAVQRADGR